MVGSFVLGAALGAIIGFSMATTNGNDRYIAAIILSILTALGSLVSICAFSDPERKNW